MLHNKILLLLLLTLSGLRAQDFSQGIKLIKYEKYNEAQKFFTSQLSAANSATAFFYLGQIQFIKQNSDSAKLYYMAGIKQNSESALNYAGMVKVCLNQDNISEAELNQKKAIDIADDKNELVFIVLAEAYMNPKIKEYNKALNFINRALKINPKNVNSYILLGNLYLNEGNGTEAIKNFEKALDIDKNNSEAITCKANVYSLINNNEDAIKLLMDAIIINPAYSPAYNSLAELYASLKDYNKASEYYEKYLNASEQTPERLKRYASILFINKDYEKAISILEDNEAAQKDIISSTRILAYSYLKLNKTEKSRFYFEKLFGLASAQFLPTDYENYADLLSSIGNDSLAVKYLLKLVESDSSRKNIWGKISVLSFKLKDWGGVIFALEAKKILTTQEYFDLGKADIFKGDRNINDLIESLNSSLLLSEEQLVKLRTSLLLYQRDFIDANFESAKIQSALNKLVSSVESSLNSNQKSKWAETKQAWTELVRAKIGFEYAKADSALAMLTAKAPNLAISYFWRARIKTDFDPESEAGLAKPFYEQFIRLASQESEKFKKELVEAYSYLGYYYYLQKDNLKSKSYWQEVLNLDPQNKQANSVVKQLK